uniref:Transposase-associated domain-containing protein n=1 Tax=Lactuca sativa TaxID=4236 RepID=A0A9R1X6Q1_LACSA|nr:hypothetical protein LSAT_V11C700374150 [Lactuca sativa]
MGVPRSTQQYNDAVLKFINHTITDYKVAMNINTYKHLKKLKIPCLYTECVNHICQCVVTVEFHLFRYGIDQIYTNWTNHGEKETPTSNLGHIILCGFHGFCILRNSKRSPRNNRDEAPLQGICADFTRLYTAFQLVNVKSKDGMLRGDNELCNSAYEAKKELKEMHYRIQKYMHEQVQRHQSMSLLWEIKMEGARKKTYENIPAKLFQSKTNAKDFIWHTPDRKVEPDIFRHPTDSPALFAIEDKFPDFAIEPRNMRLGILDDGVDVHGGNGNHSTWPILSVIYNLPPWLCMKRNFIMLCLLISEMPRNNIYVFLAPFIDDLKLLFDVGVETFDAYTTNIFSLHAVVLWTINDYPTLSTLSGRPYSRYKSCVVCGEETYSIMLPNSNKQCYVGQNVIYHINIRLEV